MISASTLSLAWDQFRQQYHTADSRLLRWTQSCLLFFLLTLSLTSASIQTHLDKNLKQLLGADLVISQYQPLSTSQESHVRNASTNYSMVRLLDVTLTNNDIWQKVQLKVIDDSYPLQGSVSVSGSLDSLTEDSQSGPAPGEIWVGSRLFTSLGITMGQSLLVGDQAFRVSGILGHEPDRLSEGHDAVEMRAMINHQGLTLNPLDLEQARYRYLLATNADQQQELIDWAKNELPGAQTLHKKGGHPLALFWKRTENFLGLASVLLFLMAAIAIDQSSRRQLVNQKRFVALCLSMGMSRSHGLGVSIVQWLLSFVMLLPFILVLAWFAQEQVIEQLQAQFSGISAQWSMVPTLKTIGVLFVLLMAFQIPSWLELTRVSVPQLMRQQIATQSNKSRALWSIISISGLAAIYSDNVLLTGLTLGAMLSALAIMLLLTWLVLTLGEKATQSRSGLLPFTLYMMKQRLMSKSTQIMGVGLCATLLLFTLMLMKDIGQSMQNYARVHDGNLFVTQAKQEHLASIEQWAEDTGSEIRLLKPFVKGQLVGINDLSLEDFTDQPSESSAILKDPVRVHWSQDVPTNNQVVAGQWWDENTNNWQQVSVEAEVMVDMGMNLGDKLSFLIEGEIYHFTINSNHVYKSGNGSVTFWFQVPPIAMEHISASRYAMGSMELPDSAWAKLGQLWQQHPTLRMSSLKEMTERFDNTLAILTKMVLFYSLMIILLALLVIAASVKGYEADDRKKNGLLLSFGQSKARCLRLSLYEWVITALVAGVGAIFGTWLAGELIYKSQFSMAYNPDMLWLIGTLLVAMLLVCSAGLLSSRASLNASVQQLLHD